MNETPFATATWQRDGTWVDALTLSYARYVVKDVWMRTGAALFFCFGAAGVAAHLALTPARPSMAEVAAFVLIGAMGGGITLWRKLRRQQKRARALIADPPKLTHVQVSAAAIRTFDSDSHAPTVIAWESVEQILRTPDGLFFLRAPRAVLAFVRDGDWERPEMKEHVLAHHAKLTQGVGNT